MSAVCCHGYHFCWDVSFFVCYLAKTDVRAWKEDGPYGEVWSWRRWAAICNHNSILPTWHCWSPATRRHAHGTAVRWKLRRIGSKLQTVSVSLLLNYFLIPSGWRRSADLFNSLALFCVHKIKDSFRKSLRQERIWFITRLLRNWFT